MGSGILVGNGAGVGGTGLGADGEIAVVPTVAVGGVVPRSDEQAIAAINKAGSTRWLTHLSMGVRLWIVESDQDSIG